MHDWYQGIISACLVGLHAIIAQMIQRDDRPINKLMLAGGTHPHRLTPDDWLFIASLLIYLLVRLIDLADYPIYFFTDEAVQTMLAADLLRDNFHSPGGELLPTYFYNSYQYNLSISVYLQVLPTALFERSIALTRAVNVLVGLLAPLSCGLIIRNVLKRPYAWLAVLVLSLVPAWFLHSRTAFETSLAASFYALFLYAYLRYRADSPRYIFLAVIAAALTFYSYSPARAVIGLTAVLLLAVDFRYHWRQRRLVLVNLPLLALLCVPLLRFQILHPGENLRHLQILSSYWLKDISLGAKLAQYLREYARSLDLRYWFLPNNHDLARHLMNGYGHFFSAMLPFFLVGLIGSLVKLFKSPAHRTLLIALLAAPAGAAMVARGITRLLVFVIPASLLITLGTIILLDRLCRLVKSRLPQIILFFLLVGLNNWLLYSAVVNGALWHRDYGLGGMQYGALQLSEKIKDFSAENPGVKLVVSPSWTNGADTVMRYFFGDPLPFELGSIERCLYQLCGLGDRVYVLIPEEYEQVVKSSKFSRVDVLDSLPYPDGTTGFYFTRLAYATDIESRLQQEAADRRILKEAVLTINGQEALVRFSQLDMGQVADIFDGDPNSITRSFEANPLVIEVTFPQPVSVTQISARVGGTPTNVSAWLSNADGGTGLQLNRQVTESPEPRFVLLALDQPYTTRSIIVHIHSTRDSEPAHVHLWELTIE